jgi:cobalt/nickel transport system permease protein
MLHIDLADHHRHGSSPIHRLHARTKLVATLLFAVVASLLPPGAWLAFALLWIGTLVVAHLSGLGLGFAVRRSFVALPFALAAISLPFTVAGHPLASLGPLTTSTEGTVRFVSVMLKSWVSVQAAILMTFTTPFNELLAGLRGLGLPAPLVSIVAFMYRYLFVLADEALRLNRARAARSAVPEGRAAGSLLWRGRVAGGLVGNLGLRAFERSERIHAAMLARGFQGEMRSLEPPTITDADRTAVVVGLTFLAMVALVGWIL